MSNKSTEVNEMTQSKFAKLVGVSPEAVRKAIILGKIDCRGEGRKKRIILSGVNTKAYLHDSNSQRKPSAMADEEKNGQSRGAKKITSKPATDSGSNSKPSSIFNLSEFEDGNIDLSLYSKHDLDKIKVIVHNMKSALDLKHTRGGLIDRKLVAIYLGKLYTIEHNELKPMSDKLSSKIAAIFENEDSAKTLKVSQVIASDITKVLKHISYITDKFLDEINVQSGGKVDECI